MSSILKALQKLEQDKSIRTPESLRIDTQILQNKPERRLTFAGITLTALLLFTSGSVAMFAIMKRYAVPVSVQHVKAVDTGGLIKQGGNNSADLAVSVATTNRQNQIAANLPPRQNKVSLPSTHQYTGLVRTRSDDTQRMKIRTGNRDVQVIKKIQLESPQQNQRTTPTTLVPILSVNGIAFQEGSSDSFAVVNGVSVASGSLVDGVSVAEILKDRVRFKFGTETIDVGLGKTNR